MVNYINSERKEVRNGLVTDSILPHGMEEALYPVADVGLLAGLKESSFYKKDLLDKW